MADTVAFHLSENAKLCTFQPRFTVRIDCSDLRLHLGICPWNSAEDFPRSRDWLCWKYTSKQML